MEFICFYDLFLLLVDKCCGGEEFVENCLILMMLEDIDGFI